jgi:hypothetical protein
MPYFTFEPSFSDVRQLMLSQGGIVIDCGAGASREVLLSYLLDNQEVAEKTLAAIECAKYSSDTAPGVRDWWERIG